MVNTLRVNADHGRDFHLLTDYMTKLQNFTKSEIYEFSAFPFPLHLMFDQTLSNLIVCLMISQNHMQQLHKRASMLQWILGKFDISQNEFEMRLAK